LAQEKCRRIERPALLADSQAFLDRVGADGVLFIAGQWQLASGGKSLPTIDPATGTETARIAAASAGDVDAAVTAAQAAFAGWRETTPASCLHYSLAQDRSAAGLIAASRRGATLGWSKKLK
jgi:hypothetical protein